MTMMRIVTTESLTYGLLAMGPFFIVIDSMFTGLVIGFLLSVILIVNLSVLLPVRFLFSSPYRPLVLLVINSTVILVIDNLLQAHAYPLIKHVGILFPLLALNALVLSYSESLFSTVSLRANLQRAVYLAFFLMLTLTLFGCVRELLSGYTLLSDISRFTSVDFAGFQLAGPDSGMAVFDYNAGALFLMAVLFACVNLLKPQTESTNEQPDLH